MQKVVIIGTVVPKHPILPLPFLSIFILRYRTHCFLLGFVHSFCTRIVPGAPRAVQPILICEHQEVISTHQSSHIRGLRVEPCTVGSAFQRQGTHASAKIRRASSQKCARDASHNSNQQLLMIGLPQHGRYQQFQPFQRQHCTEQLCRSDTALRAFHVASHNSASILLLRVPCALRLVREKLHERRPETPLYIIFHYALWNWPCRIFASASDLAIQQSVCGCGCPHRCYCHVSLSNCTLSPSMLNSSLRVTSIFSITNSLYKDNRL